jgi:hypothetical protein
MTAFNCAGVKRSKIPSGNNRTGRKTPKTPGSTRVAEDITLTDISRCMGDPARTAALMRRQRTHHAQLIPRNPNPQTLARTAGIRLKPGAAGANKGAEAAASGAVNG